jgi:hypothetical protein
MNNEKRMMIMREKEFEREGKDFIDQVSLQG